MFNPPKPDRELNQLPVAVHSLSPLLSRFVADVGRLVKRRPTTRQRMASCGIVSSSTFADADSN